MSERWAVLVTGSRAWTDYDAIERVLSEYPAGTVLIHGDARGADSLAAECGERFVFNVIAMPAQWKRHGVVAGPIRNGHMVRVLLALKECGHNVRVEAFPLRSSKGTRDAMRRAMELGVETRDHGAR